MDVSGKLLDILFRRMPPERILNRLNQSVNGMNLRRTPRDTFLRFAETTLFGYSEDEQAQFYLHLKNESEKLAKAVNIQPSVFMPIVSYGNHVLELRGGDPTCKLEKVLEWREVYHLLGQDLIVCACLAYNDVFNNYTRANFAWPATIRTNSGSLNELLKQGLAENHAHLNGSTQSFGISWYKLMNYPASSKEWLDGFSILLQSTIGRGTEDNILPTQSRIYLAAIARSILFKKLHRDDFATGGTYCSEVEFREACTKKLDVASYSYNVTRLLRKCYGMRIPMPDGTTACLDYALERHVFLPVADSPYRILAGERHFLYQCFRACFSGEFNTFEQDLLYFYLLLKNAFRGEMIQVNKQVGFQNFSNYERRKDLIWEKDAYWWEAYRMALNAPIQLENVVSFESRFGPAKSAKALLEKVERYDWAKWFADQPYEQFSRDTRVDFGKVQISGALQTEPHFYVLHYAKVKDKDPWDIPKFALRCRHEDLRKDIKVKTLATAEALSGSDYLCGRIRGIDGCANEVECRPEVFATAFRFLNRVRSSANKSKGHFLESPVSALSSTFHAGEDFYDIADGLRAIDEAVTFLEMKRGSRIGHALALGVDPQIHYATKSNCIILPKQNYLDNLVWLLYRGNELGLSIKNTVRDELQKKAQELFRYIYGDVVQRNHWHTSLGEYYESMKLRGDEPELYITTKYRKPRMYGCEYDQCAISSVYSELESLRNDTEIAGLYHYYHYGWIQKVKGAEPCAVAITTDYIKVVMQAQALMQTYLEQKGIVIECNPSSNVLIGTFGAYGKHPIFRFNNDGLPQNKDLFNPKLQVCINTDDLGVFDTSISFEYALLYRALKEQKGEDGQPQYTDADIERYLNNIRNIGLRVAFPGNTKRRDSIYTV